MTAMEEHVRRALHHDIEPVALEGFLADVHRGAGRRRVRRTGSIAVGLAVLTAVCVGVVAWGPPLGPDRDRDLEPAGVVRLSDSQVMVPTEMPDGLLYGLAGTDCTPGCPSVFWVENDHDRPRNVHTFTAEQAVYWVDLAPDGEHGFAFGRGVDSTVVWRTADGGRTWEAVDQELADYAYPPDVEYLGDDAYLLTRPLAAAFQPNRFRAHLWRTPIGGTEWTEVSLTAGDGTWFDMRAGLLASVGSDGTTTKLSVVGRDSVVTSEDGDEWVTAADLPCDGDGDHGPVFAGETPTTLLIWCPAPGERRIQLYRSVGLEPFEALGPTLNRGHAYPTTYPQLVGPFPVETETDGAYAVARVDGSFVRLEPDGDSTRIGSISHLLPITETPEPWTSSHRAGSTYARVPDGSVVATHDGGLTWSGLGP